MKRKISIALAVLTLLALTLACNLPGRQPAPTPSEPTPNRTMTALFELVQTQVGIPSPLPSATTAPVTITQTPPPAPSPLPTSTAVQPTQPPPSPTVTHTAALRSAGSYTAPFLSEALKLDGVWDEWKTTAYPIKPVVFGRENHTGKEDLEGSFRIGWDNTYLYLAVKVIDDQYVQNASGIDLYKGDTVELLLDVDLLGDLNSRELSGDDYQLVISPGKGSVSGDKEAYLYYPTGKAGTKSKVKIASEGGSGLYRVEAAIPWSLFGITPADGQRYGFAVSVSDNDREGENVQQSMVSMAPNRRLTDPTTWAVLVLRR
ncbi:MAG: sugar-binding protein [Chloroflexota bacterium]